MHRVSRSLSDVISSLDTNGHHSYPVFFINMFYIVQNLKNTIMVKIILLSILGLILAVAAITTEISEFRDHQFIREHRLEYQRNDTTLVMSRDTIPSEFIISE